MKSLVFIEELLKSPRDKHTSSRSKPIVHFETPVLGRGVLGVFRPIREVKLLYMNCSPSQPAEVVQYFEKTSHVSINYYLKADKGVLAYSGMNLEQEVQTGSIMAEYRESKTRSVHLKENGNYEWVQLLLPKKLYYHYLHTLCKDYENKELSRIEKLFFSMGADGQLIKLDNREEHLLKEIFHCSLPEGNLKSKFMQLKLEELLIYFFHRVLEFQGGNSPEVSLLSATERQELMAVKNYLDFNLFEPLNYSEIFILCQSSPYKVKGNFKYLFGVTIREYHYKKRMNNILYRLAYQEGTSIKSAAFDAGYSTVQAFSRAFYNEFGVRPSLVARKTKSSYLPYNAGSAFF